MYQLVDFTSRKRVEADNLVFTGVEGPWEVVMDLDSVRGRISEPYFKKSPPYLAKYLPFMPIRDTAGFVTLEEGATPLIRSRRIGAGLGLELYFKLEGKNPTGSFKDRGSALEMSVARELGARGLTVASTGNMAASCACYAAFAGIPCFIFVPEGTPPSKMSQAMAFGGRIVQVKGSYNQAADLARKVAEDLELYLAGDYAFRVEGQKTAAFEIVDQLFYRCPDAVVLPIGCGTNMAAYAKGFREYASLGFIEKVPALFGVQAEGAASVVRSFEKRSRTVEALERVDTICSAIGVSFPLDGVKALDAIYSSGGAAAAVSDREALEAQYMLAREEGLFVETSSATSLAGLIKLASDRRLAGMRVVCVLSGDGLKDPASILKMAIKPATIAPDVSEFRKLYDGRFFEGKPVSFVDREETRFESDPDEASLAQAVEEIGQQLSRPNLKAVKEKVASFLRKGKPVSLSDLQDIVQHVLETPDKGNSPVFSVRDFEVTTGKGIKPSARVCVLCNGTEIEARADGAGPVDALINALEKAADDDLEFSLSDYKVDIRSRGTDAVVFVELRLTRNGSASLGTGASPDIIEASLEAFEEAYNGFYR